MPWSRRSFALALAAATASAHGGVPGADAPTALLFPRDFGAHPRSRIEWWYATGALEAGPRLWGFQITFFRAATGIDGAEPSRFSPGQIVFAHAAITDLEQRRLRHDQRIARSGFGIAGASSDDTALALRGWSLVRRANGTLSRYVVDAGSDSAGFRFALNLDATQPVLLQGDGGLSRKGPDARHSSRYYSEPQLAVQGTLSLDRGPPITVGGRAWLDHEWSDALLDPNAVGWDWIGMNLDDGGALTAFRLRRADGSRLWAGGSHRSRSGPTRDFAPGDVAFVAGRRWKSPASGVSYPVQWSVETPVGRFGVQAVLEDQELDSRASSGAIYWEGLAQLVDAGGHGVGRGYLEMTGYAAPLVL